GLAEDRPFLGRPSVLGFEPGTELCPDALVRPRLELLGRRALEVHPLDVRRPGAHQHETALVHRVYQFVGRWRCLAQDAEPAEGIKALVDLKHACGNRRPADALRAIAAGDEVSGNLLDRSLLASKADFRGVAVEVVDADIPGFE